MERSYLQTRAEIGGRIFISVLFRAQKILSVLDLYSHHPKQMGTKKVCMWKHGKYHSHFFLKGSLENIIRFGH